MKHSDPIGALVVARTGRTLDQRAIDTDPAAADVPGIAELVRRTRRELVLTIDDLYQLFAFNADAHPYRSPATVLEPVLESLLVFASQYLQSRELLDVLIAAMTPHRRGTRPAQAQPHRRYLQTGDVVHVILPRTATCIVHGIAGRVVRVTDTDAETSLIAGPNDQRGRLRLAHHDAGIYRDPATGRLYTLDRTAI